MVTEHEEVEVKYSREPDAPPLQLREVLSNVVSEAPGTAEAGVRIGDLGEHDLEAVYFDTADLRLSAANTTVRRRTGGTDAGWHLKTPTSNGSRLERRVPLGRAVRTVPIALRRLVQDLTGGQPLVPVAEVNTHRRVHTVLDGSGARLLEVSEDHVAARRLLPSNAPGEALGTEVTWDEVELELLGGDRTFFDTLDTCLQGAGLIVSNSSSKLARVLSGNPEDLSTTDTSPTTIQPAPDRLEAGPEASASDASAQTPTDSNDLGDSGGSGDLGDASDSASVRTLSRQGAPRRKTLSSNSAAAEVLLLHLREQVEQIFVQERRVRADEPDSVHKMRVATRRLRSALRTFQPLLATPTKPVRDELRWLAAELGQARDAEVLRDRLVQAVASLDVALEDQPADPAATGAVPQQVAEQLGSAYRDAHDNVLTQLDTERYQHLLDTLQDFVEQPRWTTRGRRSAGKVLPKRVGKTYRTLAGLVDAAHRRPAGHDRDELLHEARKAAKQVRYAAEAVATVFGKDAKRFAAAVTEVQEVLGEHQDSVVTRQQLSRLAAAAPSDVAFAYGRLHAHEELHAAATEDDFDDVWAALEAKRLHRWLR